MDCIRRPQFAASANFRAQMDIGGDPPVRAPAWATAVPDRIRAEFPRDLGGIGHFGARNAKGPFVARMLMRDCLGRTCRGDYRGRVLLWVAPLASRCA